jgi:X box-binding protein 1
MSTPIVIASIPKYITIKAGKANSSSQSSGDMSDSSCGNEVLDEFLVRGKKRKLDHLTWEEKLQRK